MKMGNNAKVLLAALCLRSWQNLKIKIVEVRVLHLASNGCPQSTGAFSGHKQCHAALVGTFAGPASDRHEHLQQHGKGGCAALSDKTVLLQDSESIRNAVLRYDITHPVVNDGDMAMWRSMGAASWPTIAVLSPQVSSSDVDCCQCQRLNQPVCSCT